MTDLRNVTSPSLFVICLLLPKIFIWAEWNASSFFLVPLSWSTHYSDSLHDFSVIIAWFHTASKSTVSCLAQLDSWILCLQNEYASFIFNLVFNQLYHAIFCTSFLSYLHALLVIKELISIEANSSQYVESLEQSFHWRLVRGNDCFINLWR